MLAALVVEPQWLFWPASLPSPQAMCVAGGGDDRAIRLILRARLKGVILYGNGAGESGCRWSLALSGGAAELLSESIHKLPETEANRVAPVASEFFRETPAAEFLGLA